MKKITDFLNVKNTGKYGFVNIYPERDVELYLNSNLIRVGSKLGIDDFDVDVAYGKILDFFKTIFSNYNANNLHYLTVHEINDTHFGMSVSSSNSRGKGPSIDSLNDFVDEARSKIDLAIMSNPNFFSILVPRVGPDYFSDLITNIIFKELYFFTEKKLNKIISLDKLKCSSYKSYRYWDMNSHRWEMDYFKPFDIGGFNTVLVPTQIVSKKPYYDVDYFVRDIIIDIKRNDEKNSKKGTKVKARTKSEIEKIELNKYVVNKRKNLALDEVSKNPNLLNRYNPQKYLLKMDDDNDF